MTVMQMRCDLLLWLHIWDISMKPVRFCSVTVSGKKVIIVLGCISSPTWKLDCLKMNGYCNLITCGDYVRTISKVWMPARLFRKSGNLWWRLGNLSNEWNCW